MDTPALMVGFSFFGRGSFAGSAVNDYSSQPLPQNGRLGRTRGRPALFRHNLAANNGTFLSREQGVFFGENRGKQVGPVFPRGKLLFGKEDPGSPAETRPYGRIPAGKENDVACRTRPGCRIPA
ncbi:MAG: hypothetical protein C6P37_11655 [Caldibacillus debilis]|uniref:Uncharacterized protein n=1 Tax=Caldibacillus debilis TaxID=301148 RepID=A0A3E0K352_9BACI|nr:MAG: hypothetical protein C6P37_11655 [Caldibacillus debilis]